MCLAAIEKGFTQICFTEHVDFNPMDNGYNFFNLENYSTAISTAQDAYASRISILKGVEFSEPHAYPRAFEKLLKRGFDFVLGSVHWFGDGWIGNPSYQSRHSLESLFNDYYSELLKAVCFGGFDSLAHFDFPKRYLQATFEPLEQIQSILQELIRRDIALEFNTSPLRKTCADIYPGKTIRDAYARLGGINITLGSDAHAPEEIGKDFDVLPDRVDENGFKVVTFKDRKCFPMPRTRQQIRVNLNQS
jgi:histidinol-phosphatase (PHP family)